MKPPTAQAHDEGGPVARRPFTLLGVQIVIAAALPWLIGRVLVPGQPGWAVAAVAGTIAFAAPPPYAAEPPFFIPPWDGPRRVCNGGGKCPASTVGLPTWPHSTSRPGPSPSSSPTPTPNPSPSSPLSAAAPPHYAAAPPPSAAEPPFFIPPWDGPRRVCRPGSRPSLARARSLARDPSGPSSPGGALGR